MSYFNRFPMMVYDIKNNNNYKLLPDILRRVKQRNVSASGQFIFCLLYTSDAADD